MVIRTFTIDFVFENCFLSATTPYVDSRDGRSLSIYGSECQYGKLSHLFLFYFKKYVATIYLWNQMRRPPNSCDTEQVDLKIGEKKHWLWILSPIIWAIHATWST